MRPPAAVASRRGASRYRPALVALEDRTLPSASLFTFLVDTTADAGPGSLRQAILDADAASGPSTIDFDIPGQGARTIALDSALPAITGAIVIDGRSQPGYADTPLIRLDGGPAGSGAGLVIAGPSVVVQGLAVDRLAIDAAADERLTAQLGAGDAAGILSLADSAGTLLVQSDGAPNGSPAASIDEHLASGSYALGVQVQGGGDFVLTTTMTPSAPPSQPLSVSPDSLYGPMAVGDFDGDGISDIAAPDGIHRGLGDGTFAAPTAGLGLSAIAGRITAMAAGDFNGDGRLDLAVAYSSQGSDPGGVVVLLGDGDGTFQAPHYEAAGDNPAALVVGDFTSDGRLDLAVADKGGASGGASAAGGVSILLGNGDGTFQPARELIEPGDAPQALVTGDFTGGGRLELAVANRASDDVSILGVGVDGMPQLLAPPTPVGTTANSTPYSIVAGDFDGDGTTDLAVADYTAGEITILQGDGDGTFRIVQECPVGAGPQSLLAGDFLGDGRTDLAMVDTASDEVSVLPGNGDGTFGDAIPTPLAGSAVAIVAGDFNGDGRLDLAVAGASLGSGISILLGEGDGLFQTARPSVGAQPVAEAVGDFNGDGYLDLAIADASSRGISILLGNGDGTFQTPAEIALGFTPAAIVAGDFNGDGRLDLAVAGSPIGVGPGEVAVLLGNGDGTFQPPEVYTVGYGPDAIVAGDFGGDGRLDLAVADSGSDDVSILMGRGDGTFLAARSYPVGQVPVSLVAGNFDGDGPLDLAVADEGLLLDGREFPGGVSVLIGNGDGTFQPASEVTVGPGVSALAAGDFAGDGTLDLAAAVVGEDGVSILPGDGDGTFQPPQTIALGFVPTALEAGDFNGDGRTDLAVAAAGSAGAPGDVAVLLGDGDGTFQPREVDALGSGPLSLAVGDFNGDGKSDLAVLAAGSNAASVLLGDGDGTFTDAGQLATTPRATPLVADVNGDGTEDVLVVDAAGQILYRQGRPQQPGTFDPPVIVNPGAPSRDIAWVPVSGAGGVIASVDADDDGVTLFADRGGSFLPIGTLATGRLPAQIVAADLTGDGRLDLVVRDAGDDTLSVYLNVGGAAVPVADFTGPRNPADDLFEPEAEIPVGPGASDVEAIDASGTGRPDLVVTSKLTGQVSLLANLGDGRFSAPVPYRAGTGLSAIDPGGTPEVSSLDATAGVAGGPLVAGGPPDLVAIDPGSNTMAVLAGLGGGLFANPTTLETPSPGEVVCMADFTGDGIDDLAVLTPAGLDVYLGDGKGGFLPPTTYAVGPDSTGLTVADVNHDGKLDLLVGDAFGDVLVLLGQGDGTFQPYHEVDRGIELAVANPPGGGAPVVVYADQALGRVVVDDGTAPPEVLADHLLNPGAVALVDLNGDGIPDLVVADSGDNSILIYPGLGGGRFGPEIDGGHGLFVGTDPVAITAADLSGPLPDLVIADEGSNQVSILINRSSAGGPIAFSAGPRLDSGGSGPVSTAVGDFGGPYPDLLVTNSGSNDVALLPGVGQGFFDDQAPRTFPVGPDPVAGVVGTFDGRTDLVTADAGSNELTILSGIHGPDPALSVVPSGGLDPSAVFAFSADDGFEDLVVGNSGDGSLALFEGGDEGLSLASVSHEPSLPDLTDLAFLAMASGQVEFLAATAGLEAAQLLTLNLDSAVLSTVTATVLQIVPLREPSSLPIVASAMTLTLEPTAEESGPGLAPLDLATVAASPETIGAPGQGPSARPADLDGEETEPEAPDDPDQSPDSSTVSTSSAWERLFLGPDEVLETLRGRAADTPQSHDRGPMNHRDAPAIAPDPSGPEGRTAGIRPPDGWPRRDAGAGRDSPAAPVGDAPLAAPNADGEASPRPGPMGGRPSVEGARAGSRIEPPPAVSTRERGRAPVPWPLLVGALIAARVRFVRRPSDEGPRPRYGRTTGA